MTVDGTEYPATGSATQWTVITDTTIPLTANQEVSFFLSRYTDLAGNEQVTPTQTATKGTDSMSVYIDGTPPAPESVIVSSSIKTSNLLKKTNPSDSQQQLSLPGDQLTLDFTTNEHLHEVYVTVDGKEYPATGSATQWNVITDTTIPLTANQEVSFFLSRYTDLAGNEQVTPTETATKGTDSMSVYIDGTPPAPESVIVSSSIKTSNLLKKTNPSDSQQQLSFLGIS